ncbi:unnamed protein product, partial [Amoebophrya sp. A120]
ANDPNPLPLAELKQLAERLRVGADLAVIHIVEDTGQDIPTARELLGQMETTLRLRTATERVKTAVEQQQVDNNKTGFATAAGGGTAAGAPSTSTRVVDQAHLHTPTRPLAGAMSFRQQQKLQSLSLETPQDEQEQSMRYLSHLVEISTGRVPQHELQAAISVLSKIRDGARDDAKRLLMAAGRSPTNRDRPRPL